MKKMMILVIAILAMVSIAAAQTTPGSAFSGGTWSTSVPGGVTAPTKGFTIDKLGAHQNGGRGCVGCHAPHSGARGNGGAMVWNPATSKYDLSVAVGAEGTGDETLWGQDLTPIYGTAIATGAGAYDFTITTASPERMVTGVAMCLSCHDGNVARGAMMTNQSFEQANGMLPASYGTQTIPTLLGNDGTGAGNYDNDHPVGPKAKLGLLPIKASSNVYALTAAGAALTKGTSFAGSQFEEFYKNYGAPLSIDARTGAGWATDLTANVDDAYVVCTTCHTPHSMYTTTAKLNGVSKGTVPTFFFIAAPYNPGANVADGTKASSATQFCRQCHFTGAGGSNEGSGISIPTAF